MKLSDLLVPSTKFSKFRCDTYKKFSANPGILYPVWMQLLNPGESASIDLRNVIRTWPVESPLMGSMKVRFVTAVFNIKNYAMALEGYNRKFDWLSVNLPHFTWRLVGKNQMDTLNYYYRSDSLLPGSTLVNQVYLTCVHDTSLMDYLGFESGFLPSYYQFGENVPDPNYSLLPYLCYYDFYRNYLINPQESHFPIFSGHYDIKSNPDPSHPYVAYNKSVVSLVPVSDLDDFIMDCHKYYDGSLSAGSYNNQGGSFFQNFVNTNVEWNSLRENLDDFIMQKVRCNSCSVSHGGLVSTLFDSDLNTQWLSVDNYKKLDDVKVNTKTSEGNSFTSFVDIVKASSLWDFITKSVNSDGTYGDFIGNQFGVPVKGDMNIPQIVHVYDTLLTFDDITSQSDTVTSSSDSYGAFVGQQFGVGRSFGQSSNFRVVNKDGNYVILMTFMWATPQICYSTGNSWLHDISSFSDLYQPSFDNYAMQPRLQKYVKSALRGQVTLVDSESNLSRIGYVDCVSSPDIQVSLENIPHNAEIGYQPAFSEYKSDVDSVHGLFRHALDYYTIIRDVPIINEYNSTMSAYVYSVPDSASFLPVEDAQRYSLPFAIDAEDCMQVQLRVACTITRAMSKNVNPNFK